MQWRSYIDYELNRAEFDRVEQLFPRCLTTTTSVDLCRTYVSYVCRRNDVVMGGEKARGIIILAFEFAVDKVGIDVSSADLWQDFVDFIRSWTPTTSWETQQKTDLLRKTYKRFLGIPTEKIESMWSSYTRWENETNPATASKFIAEKSTEFMDARSWNTEWHNVTRRLLKREIVPVSIQENAALVKAQLGLWEAWLELERKNSLNLKEDSSVQKRVDYVYRQAVTSLPFVPEIWFRYSKFLLSSNEEANVSKCISLLSNGVQLNPHSFLLAFQLSELHEKDHNFSKASETLEKLISTLIADHTVVTSQIDAITSKVAQEAQPSVVEKEAKPMGADSDDEDEPKNVAQQVVQLSEFDQRRLAILRPDQKLLNNKVTLVYTKLMMLCKRSQGIKESRAVFKQARKNFKPVGFELYTENALMEYYSDNKKTADKVFELSMKTFSTNGEFLLSYLDYLILTNSVESIKVFFEVAVTNLLKEISTDQEIVSLEAADIMGKDQRNANIKENQMYIRKIITRYIRFATNYLDLDTVESLEKRYEQFFPEDDPLSLFSDRYKGFTIDAVREYDLGIEAVEEPTVESPNKKRKTVTPTAPAALVPDNGPSLPQHGFVGNSVYALLQVLPNASYFGPPSERVFNTSKLVELLSTLPEKKSE